MKNSVLNFLKPFILLLSLSINQQIIAQLDQSDLIANMKETLELSDDQTKQVNEIIGSFSNNVNGILEKYEGQEEPDMGEMIAEIRGERDKMDKGLKGSLSKEQYEKYKQTVDETKTMMFNDIAEIKLMDIQPKTDLTDEQVEKLAPVFGKSIKKTLNLLFENAGTRLSIPKKISLAKQLKKIQSEQRKGMEQILTPEQMAKYDAYKEEQKNKK